MRELHYVAKAAHAAEPGMLRTRQCGETGIEFVRLCGHSFPLAQSLYRGVSQVASHVTSVAMRDDPDKEDECAAELQTVWKAWEDAHGDVNAAAEAKTREAGAPGALRGN